MNTHQNLGITFYQHLGKLFYAIAAADKVVRSSERQSLQEFVQSVWVTLEDQEDEFGDDTAYQIEIVFDWLDHEEPSTESCFKEFESYYIKHPSFFSKNIKQLIWDTANAIADAFAGKNKSELTMLGKLHILFNRDQ
ncbi:hypothetical protein [Aquimarina pacifica]|uniref:hypothetical protein n=1 Tax=Aquimarina pacifica TaxID=1296415 RepID=UPI0004715BCF|nr:hypothetical protein [Aquimarina pacifica]